MTRKETIKKLIEQLRKRRLELHRAIGHVHEELSAESSADFGELAVRNEHAEVASRLAESEAKELKQINEALLRYRKRKFGVCSICRKNIPLNRLRALPYVKNCVKCKELSESSKQSPFPPIDLDASASNSNVLL